MLPNQIIDRAELLIMGVNLQTSFKVGEGYLRSIILADTTVNNPVRGLNYTLSPLAILPQTQDVQVSFVYMYEDNATLFDFSALPYTATNIQLTLQHTSGVAIALVYGLYYRQSVINYSAIGKPVSRTISLGAFGINYF